MSRQRGRGIGIAMACALVIYFFGICQGLLLCLPSFAASEKFSAGLALFGLSPL